MYRLDFIKIETNWEKVFITYIIEQELIIRVYKEILKIKNPIKNEKRYEKISVE